MKLRMLLLGAALALLPLTAQAQVKDPAELFPSHALAYLEVCKPAQLARETEALLKGSYLDNLPVRMARFREKLGDREDFFFYDSWMIGSVGIIFSPEMLAEFGRLQGGAVALTGFTKDKEPEIVGVVLAGDSNAPTFLLRMYLSMDQVGIVSEVEGVQLFRPKRPDYRNFKDFDPGKGDVPRRPPIREMGPTFALLPGAVVIGSTTDSVKDVVRRFKGKNAEPALTAKTAFKESAKLRDKPGLFGYADLTALTGQLDEIFKDGGSPEGRMWADVKALINPKAFRTLIVSLALQNGGLELNAQLSLDPKQSSPLLEILPDKKVKAELLHAVPKDSVVTLALALPDGEKRWEKILSLLDGIARSAGAPDAFLPSKVVQGMETKTNINLGKEVFAKIDGVALALDVRGADLRRGPPFPLLVLNATDAEAAKNLEDRLPQLMTMFGATDVGKPTTERIQGQAIRSLPADRLPWGAQVHYGRQGTVLVVGPNRDAVAEGLLGSADKKGLLGNARVAELVKGFDEPVALGTWSLGQTLTLAMREWSRSEPAIQPKFDFKDKDGPGGFQPVPPPRKPDDKPPARSKEAAKFIQDMTKLMDTQPPAVLALSRKPDRLTLEMRQPSLRTVSAKAIDLLIDSLLHEMATNRPRFGPGGTIIPDKEIPLPPPPVPIDKKRD
jgi:hypothetical protein